MADNQPDLYDVFTTVNEARDAANRSQGSPERDQSVDDRGTDWSRH
jgi:hypothetical protein